jgi:hypothetical protein
VVVDSGTSAADRIRQVLCGAFRSIPGVAISYVPIKSHTHSLVIVEVRVEVKAEKHL